MLQPHTQLPLTMALRSAAAMLLASFGRRNGVLLRRFLSGLRLRDRAFWGSISPAALPCVSTLVGRLTLQFASTLIPFGSIPCCLQVNESWKCPGIAAQVTQLGGRGVPTRHSRIVSKSDNKRIPGPAKFDHKVPLRPHLRSQGTPQRYQMARIRRAIVRE